MKPDRGSEIAMGEQKRIAAAMEAEKKRREKFIEDNAPMFAHALISAGQVNGVHLSAITYAELMYEALKKRKEAA